MSESSPGSLPLLPPADFIDPVIEVYKRDVDVTLLIENLLLTPAQRWEKAESFIQSVREWRGAAKRSRQHLGIGPTITAAESVVRTPSSGRGRPDDDSRIPSGIDAPILTEVLS